MLKLHNCKELSSRGTWRTILTNDNVMLEVNIKIVYVYKNFK